MLEASLQPLLHYGQFCTASRMNTLRARFPVLYGFAYLVGLCTFDNTRH